MTAKCLIFRSACAVSILCSTHVGNAQTFQVTPGGAQATNGPAANGASNQLGWGSNIQNARLANAAQQALQRGDHVAALTYAERAAQAAPGDAQLQFLQGYAARLDGRFGEAIAAYNRGLKINGGAVDGLSGLAQTYAQMGRGADAAKLFKEVLARDPSRIDDLVSLGNIDLQTANYDDAISSLLRAERGRPDARTELLLAIAYEHLKQPEQANRYLQLAKSRSPNNPDVERSLAGYYRGQGDYTRAIAELTAIKNPRPDITAELAYTYKLGGQPEQAAHFYAQAANAMPRDLNLQLSAAEAAVSAGQPDAANPFLARAASIAPDSYRLHATRAQIAQMEDREADAANELAQALAHMPAAPDEGPLYPIQLRLNLMALYRDLGKDDLAAEQLALAQKEVAPLDIQGPDRASFLRLRALVKFNEGQLDSALADMQESLALTPGDINSLQIDGDLLAKLNRTADAVAVYNKILTLDPKNRFALTSLGYASRLQGNDQKAEEYFLRLAKNYPTLYIPYLALGDMYASHQQYRKALDSYAKAYALNTKNASIVAGGIASALESHDVALAGTWVQRVTDPMEATPAVLREEERYYYFQSKFDRSLALGQRAVALTPEDREVVVYLGYDLLHLERWTELETLLAKYNDTFPKDPNIPLLAGYVYKHNGDRDKALAAFTEAIKRDPDVETAYVNRGFILNDLGRPSEARDNFEEALRRNPNDGESHLGLAFAELNLHHPQSAIQQSQVAEKLLGDSEALHLIRATAYGREGMLDKAVAEYQAAIKFAPNDGTLYLGLGNALFAQRKLEPSVQALLKAEDLMPEDPEAYALSARVYADMHDRDLALRQIALAEKYALLPPKNPTPVKVRGGASAIYLQTGEAFLTLGDQKSALDRFTRALDTPDSDRVGVRLAIAQLMAGQQRQPDADRQIALAQMEAEAGLTEAPTADQYIQASSIFQQMHEYDLSNTYLGRADAAGATASVTHVARANDYLAQGDTARAATELAAVHDTTDSESNYSFLLAEASLYQQQHQGTRAITAFAQAASIAGQDQTAEQSLLRAGSAEGYPVNSHVSLLSNTIVQPIFEDTTDYVLDSKLDSPTPVAPTDSSALPPPRSSVESDEIVSYHLHAGNFPDMGGFVQERNTRGTISIPENRQGLIHRDTFDTIGNFGIAPVLRVGRNAVTFNTGVEGTLRRDSDSPTLINQNLFRAFSYVSTTTFMNAVSGSGYIIFEKGPFTDEALNSRTLAGAVDFRVGAPWSKTSLVTGWGATDQQFTSKVSCSGDVYPCGFTENYYTSSYIGLARNFGARLKAEALIADIRSWRTVPFFGKTSSAIAQDLKPSGTIDFAVSRNWDIQANSSFESTRGFHVYDMTDNGIAVSYTRAFGTSMNDQTGEVHVKYPVRLSLGVQEETFPNFTAAQNQQFRPYVSLTLF